MNNPKDKVWATRESTAAEDDSYLGYSSATGDFNGDGVQGVAVGMPRGGGLLGKVLIFSWNMTNQQNITGEQIGAYFGYSLCVVDVDGDKLDDLVVGAPMYTEPNNEGKYEMGRVYIIYQDKYVSCCFLLFYVKTKSFRYFVLFFHRTNLHRCIHVTALIRVHVLVYR